MFDNIWMHILILIPLEFGLLHATPLGGMLVSMFQSVFSDLGFQFAAAAAHGAPGHVCGLTEAFSAAAPAIIPPAPLISAGLPGFGFENGILAPK